MRPLLPVAALACALSACGHTPTSAERQAADDKAIAEVEANQTPPPDTPELQEITAEEINSLGLIGGGCTFYGKDNSEQALALVQPEAAYLKIDGDVERLASDPGSPGGPMDTHQHYDGKKHSLVLAMSPKPVSTVSDALDYATSLTLRDGHGRVEMAMDGTARCGS